MNYDKYDAISCKRWFYLLICNDLIDPGNQLLIITNTMKIIAILQPSNLNVFLHGYSLQYTFKVESDILLIKYYNQVLTI